MNKKEYKDFIDEQYKDDPEGFAIYLNLLFEVLRAQQKRGES
ncbi:MAG: hypothetical protein ACFFDN_26595 [Candidatus Hodarchaeota archaeon]